MHYDGETTPISNAIVALVRTFLMGLGGFGSLFAAVDALASEEIQGQRADWFQPEEFDAHSRSAGGGRKEVSIPSET